MSNWKGKGSSKSITDMITPPLSVCPGTADSTWTHHSLFSPSSSPASL